MFRLSRLSRIKKQYPIMIRKTALEKKYLNHFKNRMGMIMAGNLTKSLVDLQNILNIQLNCLK